MKRLIPLLVVVCITTGIAILNSCKKDPVLPTISTTELTAKTTISVTSGGLISKDGGAAVTARGVCWSTTSNPTTGDTHTSDGTGTGSFASNITGLTPNTLYHIRAFATNKVGTAYGADLSFTTSPIILPTLTTADVTSVTVNTAISGGNITSDGNGTITARGVCWATTTAPTTANSLTNDSPGTGIYASNLSGLTSGVKYYVRAYATNSAGTAYGNEIFFNTVLAAPTNVAATAGNAQATVTFSAPVGAAGITGYAVTSTPGGITASGSGSPITITGLTNGTSYTFTVNAINAYGNGAASVASNPVVPSTGPGAPTIGTATAANAQATVTFTAPANNGGSAITGYTVTSNPGNITAVGSASPITVTGLTNGTAYTFTVFATNAKGNSSPSAASNSVTPSTIPGAPAIGVATGGNTQATIAFIAPTSTGGSAITGYTAISNPGNITGTGTASPITVNGLTNGTSYTFTVIATNVIGNGPASSASNSVIPSTVPGAPTIGTATKGNALATVAFTAPANTGGSAITGYTATSTPGNFTGTGTSSPITVTGLTNGIAYTFTVVAANATGTGPASTASNSVIPSTVPGVPTIGTATKGNALATVAFTAPANGGSVITGYTATSTPGNLTGTATSSPITISGLTNGTSYTFTVIATNANGSSSQSLASNSVIPSTLPDAPVIGTATKGNALATVAFTAPANTGGSAITGYTATSTPGNFTGTGTSSPITVTGLTNGSAYTFTVVATNINGSSSPSLASNSVTPSTVPGAPTIGTATEGDAQVSVTFTAPVSNGGSAITVYTVTSTPGNKTMTGTTSPITVTGLTNGTAYTFAVTASNINGIGSASSASNLVIPHTLTTIYDRDLNLYNLVTINGQVWTASNLITTKFSNGDPIPTTGLTTDITGETSPIYQWTDHDAALNDISATYGRVYTWYAAIDGRNVCPTGFHVPTAVEIDALTTFLGGDALAGGHLKESGTTHWVGNVGATDDYGFTALPAGARYPLGTFSNAFTEGYFWTSTIDTPTLSWGSGLISTDGSFLRLGYLPKAAVSIRCLKN